ncbi:MAG: GNAT family acetyltransferase [Anaerolineales bacterium]
MFEFDIREFHLLEDYDSAVKLWASMEVGITVGRSDTLEEIEKKIKRDPDLFLIAEVNGKLVGTIIGGYDGRRGMIYHLAVDKEFRKQGIGARLISEVEHRLRNKGCLKCYLLVTAENTEAMKFYEQQGWRNMKEDYIFGKEFS